MTNEQYHNAQGVSSSDFRLLEKSPIHFENKAIFKLQGSQFDLGSLVHKMVLEPDDIADEFVKEDFEGADLNKNTKIYKENKAKFLHENSSKTIIPLNIWEQAEKMASNVMTIAGGLLQNGTAEDSFFVKDGIFDITRKCRPDYYREDLGLVIDLKTTADGSEYGFSKSLQQYKYARQAAWYLDTLSRDGINAERFIFITVESKAPYMVDVWEIDPISVAVGRDDYTALLEEYAKYKKTGVANVVKTISLPDWAIKEYYEEV